MNSEPIPPSATGSRRLRVVEAGETEGAVRVAFATQDLHTLDAHFAGARNLAIYDVAPGGWRFVEAVRFDEASQEDGVHEGPDDRIASRLEALAGCALVFVLAIGGPAAAQVVSRRIHPVKVPRPEPIGEILGRLQTMLAGTPPPWLRKVLRPGGAAPRSNFLDEDDDE
jgi:nitrogen fixation protein NifX